MALESDHGGIATIQEEILDHLKVGKLAAGEKGWIGVVGVCRMIPQGGPLTAESCDGSIEVEKILFYDQKEDRKESLKILE